MQTQAENPAPPILRIIDLHVHFPIREGFLIQHHATVKAVNGLSFQLNRGDVFGLVGESGCGKTTLGRAVVGLAPVTSGKICFNSHSIGVKQSAIWWEWDLNFTSWPPDMKLMKKYWPC